MTEPVKKRVVIETSRERAFSVFTEGIDEWWPRSHHIGKSPMKRTVIEPHLGGRWYSESEDGTECNVGRVLVWEPPARLVLTWQITSKWEFDPNFETEVEVRFTELGPKRTQVDFEHRNLERYGVDAPKHRSQIDSAGGWTKLLDDFRKCADGEDSEGATFAIYKGAH